MLLLAETKTEEPKCLLRLAKIQTEVETEEK